MVDELLRTKLFIPHRLPHLVHRPDLLARLNLGLQHGRKLTLVSAAAGFGKTTLLGQWDADLSQPVAWLTLDERDGDPFRFLAYVVAALQTILPEVGSSILDALQSPQPPPVEQLLTTLVNELAGVPDNFILILDDYHELDAQPVDAALNFLLDHLPPQMHLAIATREDPPLPLARLRARNQLTEVRVADLRFTSSQTTEFLNRAVGLDLAEEEIAALETRTEGWIAGLQLAAISLRSQEDTSTFIHNFSGSHFFVLDYLLQEVLEQQPDHIQAFLMETSILDRICGPLCEAVTGTGAGSGQESLDYLVKANLFVIPLDNERRWYRFHRLFADLLQHRLRQKSGAPAGAANDAISKYHVRAAQWYEENGWPFEAFRHAAAANDIERAERLIGARDMPLHFRGTTAAILDWLASLPPSILDQRPSLRVSSATIALLAGQTDGVDETLQAAEAALARVDLEDEAQRNLTGKIAAARATLALTRYQPQAILVQARRALDYLPAENLPFRFTAYWALGFAHSLQGNRAAAGDAYTEAITLGQRSGDTFSTILATDSLGQLQEQENRLHQAADSYRRVLSLAGTHPHPNVGETHLGLARIHYEWNDLQEAERHGQESRRLLHLYDSVIDRFILAELFLARLRLVQGDATGAMDLLVEAEQAARRHHFVHRLPEIAAAQAHVLLRQGNGAAAARIEVSDAFPLVQARIQLARGDSAAALALLQPLRQEMEEKQWHDQRLRVMLLQAVARHFHGDEEAALRIVGEALALAEPAGFIRLFVDEGPPMAQLLSRAATRGIRPRYTAGLLEAFAAEPSSPERERRRPPAHLLADPLSERELEVLRLLAEGLSNREIGERLFLALDTIKGHNRRIYAKLQVRRRTEAVARARELGLL